MRERRFIPGKVESRALTEAEKSAGYIGVLTGVIPLNTDSVTLRDRRLNNGQPFVERIAPKAFSSARDVIGVAGHTDDPLSAFARQGANLTIVETEREIRWEALLPNTQAGRDLAELGPKLDEKGGILREGIIRGTSFEFEHGAEDKWEKRADGTAVRTVVKGQLCRVNPVLDPAYGASSLTVSMRERLGRAYIYNPYASDYETHGDPSATNDVAFACSMLGMHTSCLMECLAYLRAEPAGAHAKMARAEADSCAAKIGKMADWLAENGGTAAADYMERAAEARAQHSSLSKPPSAEEERVRMLGSTK